MQQYLPIFLLNIVNVIGFSLLLPVLPYVVEQYVEPQYVGAVYGILISAYALFQFLAAPILGAWSDRFGRKPILFLSQLGTTLSWVVFGAAWFIPDISLFGLSVPLIVIVVARVVDGITGGNISVAEAWVSDITAKKDKTRIFGILGATFAFGFLLGPALGGFTSATSIGFLGTAIAAFLLSVVTLCYIAFKLPESLPPDKRDDHLEVHWLEQLNFFKRFTPFRGNRLVMNLLFLRIFFAVVFASYTTLVVLLLQTDYDLPPGQVGVVLSIMAVFSIVNQGFLVQRIAARIGNIRTLYLSFVCLFIGLIALTILPAELAWGGTMGSLVLFVIIAYIFMLGVATAMPTFKAVLTNHVDEKKQGAITGLDSALISFGQAVTPVIAGALYSFVSHWTFAIYAGILLIPHVVIWIREGHPVLRGDE
ncbi:MAG: MFS transporter [Patescibacteria group bacterium]